MYDNEYFYKQEDITVFKFTVNCLQHIRASWVNEFRNVSWKKKVARKDHSIESDTVHK
jgi:hypothetical protein